jgi:hypothetical protein
MAMALVVRPGVKRPVSKLKQYALTCQQLPSYANWVNILDFGVWEPQESIYGTAFADEFERGVQLGMSKSELMDVDCQLRKGVYLDIGDTWRHHADISGYLKHLEASWSILKPQARHQLQKSSRRTLQSLVWSKGRDGIGEVLISFRWSKI